MATAIVLERANEIHVALLQSTPETLQRCLDGIVKPIRPEPGFIGRNLAHEVDKLAYEHLTGKRWEPPVGDEDAFIRSRLKRRYVVLETI